jgi:hypothetical protein
MTRDECRDGYVLIFARRIINAAQGTSMFTGDADVQHNFQTSRDGWPRIRPWWRFYRTHDHQRVGRIIVGEEPPRRDQVNDRLGNQDRRINRERRAGEITGSQAKTLHTEDHQIRQEERTMASQNGGHITRGEQRVLNQQENGVSRQIGNPPGGTSWDQSHPRRDQVNDRLANQNGRITQERREGEITGSQAKTLHTEDHQIRQEERDMASQNGGHITRNEQQVLNQQENVVSRQIGQ